MEESLQCTDFLVRLSHLYKTAAQKAFSIELAAINLTPIFEIPINQTLLHAVRSIRRHPYLPELGDDDISDLLMELDLLVSNWGDYGGQCTDETTKLAQKMFEICHSNAVERLAEATREGWAGGVSVWVMRGEWERWTRER